MTASIIKYSYAPVPTIEKFSNSNARIRALMGPFGSGKSSGCVVEIGARGLQQKKLTTGIASTRWVVIRNSYPQLRDTTIRTFHQWFPPHLFGTYKTSDHSYMIREFPGVEIEILFRALDRPDHVSNLLSLEVTGAWVNEAREVPWAIIEALQGRVGRYPRKEDGGPTWHGILMDTNPPDVDSKFYKFFEETKHDPNFARLWKQPSGLSPQAENLANLPGGANYYTELANGKDPEWIKVYIDGEYGFVIDGKPVFPEYKDWVHCTVKAKYMPWLPIYRGWDFGLTPSCVFCQLSAEGKLVIFDEMVSDNMSLDEFSDDVLEYCSQTYKDAEFYDIGDPAGEKRQETDKKTCFSLLHAKGIHIEGGMQSIAIRLESVKKPLNKMVMGEPGFALNPKCKTLRKGFQGGYQYRRMQTSVEKYTEKPDKNSYSHPHDALQYVCTRLFGGGLTTPRGADTEENHGDDFSRVARTDVTGY